MRFLGRVVKGGGYDAELVFLAGTGFFSVVETDGACGVKAVVSRDVFDVNFNLVDDEDFIRG